MTSSKNYPENLNQRLVPCNIHDHIRKTKRCTIDTHQLVHCTYIFRGFVEFNKHFLYRESCHDSNNIRQESLLMTQGQHLGIAGRNGKTGHGSS